MDSYRKTQEQKENISAVFENKVKELIEFDEKDFHELTLKNLKNLKIEYLEYEDEDEALAACLNANPECDQVAKGHKETSTCRTLILGGYVYFPRL